MRKVLLFLFVSLTSYSYAQERSYKSSVEIEIDPIAFILDGYSAHGIYQAGRLRFDFGIYGLEVPESLQKTKGFRLENDGVGVKVNYLLSKIDGWYAGVGLGYSKIQASHKESGEKAEGKSIGTGGHVGYRWFFSGNKQADVKGLYITPWISFNYNVYPDKIRFASRDYKMKNLEFFPTVHVGYRF